MTRWKKWAQFLSSPFFVGLILTFSLTGATFFYYVNAANPTTSGFYAALHLAHQKSIDARLRDRGFRAPHPDVAVLTVDERALEEVGRWPWSRDKIAKIVEELARFGARMVSFDIVFAEPDQNAAGPTLRRLKEKLTDGPSTGPLQTVQSLINEELQKTDTDRKLMEAVAQHSGILVLGSYFDPAEPLTAAQELCWDVAYGKSAAFQSWSKESTQIIVNDLAATTLPTAWVELLQKNHLQLARVEADTWTQKHNGARPVLVGLMEPRWQPSLQDGGHGDVLLSYILADAELLRARLGASAEDFSDEDFERFKKEARTQLAKFKVELLRNQVLQKQLESCKQFLTDLDPLLAQYRESWPEASKEKEEWTQLDFESFRDKIKYETLYNPVTPAGRWWTSIPEILDASSNNGYFNANLDSDGTIRKSWLIARTGTQYMTSIGFRAFLQALGFNAWVTLEPNVKLPQEKLVSELKIIDGEGEPVFTIPTDNSGGILINYAGPQYSFPYLSIADLMTTSPTATITQLEKDSKTGRLEPKQIQVDKSAFIKNKVFVFGATALGIFDMRVTPFQENYAGVETHANVVDNLMRRDFLRVHPDEEVYMPLFVLGMGLLLAYALSHLSALPSLLVVVATFASIYLGDKHFLFAGGIVTTIVLPLLAVLCLFLGIVSYKYFTEERKKKEIKGTFEKYVSPAVVNEILADPANLQLGGRKETITVFFSDVRGFTTISEKLDPRALSDLLNSYLTPMTRLVFEYKGTLDKYMGDAIMAFFGAPIHYPDHAKQACKCALAHLRKLKELQAEYERKGLPSIDIGIGLNTGEASVGNMGSDIVRNYTVMGDTVNLGSRLEGINKQYGTRIIISEFTRNEIGDDFTVREIDWVRVKGKAQPVRIFELVQEGAAEGELQQALSEFNNGFDLYHKREFARALTAFTNGLNIRPDDECCKLYVERCQDYIQEPPPADWDGVYTMKTK